MDYKEAGWARRPVARRPASPTFLPPPLSPDGAPDEECLKARVRTEGESVAVSFKWPGQGLPAVADSLLTGESPPNSPVMRTSAPRMGSTLDGSGCPRIRTMDPRVHICCSLDWPGNSAFLGKGLLCVLVLLGLQVPQRGARSTTNTLGDRQALDMSKLHCVALSAIVHRGAKPLGRSFFRQTPHCTANLE